MTSGDKASTAGRRQFNFPYYIDVQTRWLDNDQYGHLNNTAYYLITDTINNTYLYDYCGIQPFQEEAEKAEPGPIANDGPPPASSVVGLVISSSAQFFAQTSFPDALRCGLRVVKLGSSSVTYEIGIFALPAHISGKRSSSLAAWTADKDNGDTQRSLPPDAQAAALVRVTHVFVDRFTRRPVKPMPAQVRQGLDRLRIDEFSDKDEKARL